MTDLAIVLTYFGVGVAVSAAITLLFVLANVGFYVFCWCFVKIDDYLQNHYWQKLHRTLQNNNQKEYKKVA